MRTEFLIERSPRDLHLLYSELIRAIFQVSFFSLVFVFNTKARRFRESLNARNFYFVSQRHRALAPFENRVLKIDT